MRGDDAPAGAGTAPRPDPPSSLPRVPGLSAPQSRGHVKRLLSPLLSLFPRMAISMRPPASAAPRPPGRVRTALPHAWTWGSTKVTVALTEGESGVSLRPGPEEAHALHRTRENRKKKFFFVCYVFN